MQKNNEIPKQLAERILSHMGLDCFPAINLHGLQQVYSSWCRHIPFDNIQKLQHHVSFLPGPLPGDDSVLFFENWLRYGTGGLCWAGNEALYQLLKTLGFKVKRGLATMMIGRDLPPNHGTVVAEIDKNFFVVDASLLHDEPLQLKSEADTSIYNPAWGVICRRTGTTWQLRAKLLHMTDGCECRINLIGAERKDFTLLNEQTRAWSPFNYSLYFRLNYREKVVGLAYGKKVTFEPDGDITTTACNRKDQLKFLIDEMGVDESILRRLPPDRPTPPPPGSHKTRPG